MHQSRILDDPSSAGALKGDTGPLHGSGECGSLRSRRLSHAEPADVPLQEALQALADPVRRAIVRELAGSPEWSRACGTFELGVSKATRSHHFTVLRQSGLVEQRDSGARRFNRLRRAEFDAAFPGLLALVLAECANRTGSTGSSGPAGPGGPGESGEVRASASTVGTDAPVGAR
ncbi:hypothetical protein GCM10009759_09790 [Kitasatospora saccharophila]|uniref:HTH arsR-type domain-containing protein n=1 Tax=Kitasatospora saccharophila TaxID=407973 RepID=A0ABP5HZ87_9ACTN